MTNLVIILLSGVLILAGAGHASAMQAGERPQGAGQEQHQGYDQQQHQAYDKEQVREAQEALRNEGFDPGPIDGVIGPRTREAIRQFQMENDLPATGDLDQQTQEELGLQDWHVQPDQERGDQITQPEARGEVQQPERGGDVTQERMKPEEEITEQQRREQPGTGTRQQQPGHPGQMGMMDQNAVVITLSQEDMRAIQNALQAHGIQVQEPAGHMQMMQAIRQFQTQRNLPATGHLDEMTMQQLNLQVEIQHAGAGITHQDPRTAPQQQPQTRTEDQDVTRQPGQTETQPGQTQRQPDQTQTQRDQIPERDRDQARTPDQDPARDTRAERDRGEVDDQIQDRVQEAATVLREMTTAGADQQIPQELLGRAEAIAVIPSLTRGGLIVGGHRGKGLMSKRVDGGRWSAPMFIELSGATVGAQIGLERSDLVLIFTDADKVQQLHEQAELELGNEDARIVAGPVGRTAQMDSQQRDAAIFAYTRERGLFAGAAINEVALEVDREANEQVYGRDATAREILAGNVSPTAHVRPFVDALSQATPRQRVTQR